MSKRARRHRISYVLELAGSQSGGHRLGVNGLAVDRENAILYSGGRDGVVCAWDLDLDLTNPAAAATTPSSSALDSSPSAAAAAAKPTTKFRGQTQAHTHWINDVVLAQNYNALVSGSSDLTVKVWRPHADPREEPATIGQHADYVKRVAMPSQQSTWVASGGLDRRVFLWDLSGAGKTLEIDTSGDEVVEKGSVYALSVNHSIIANGGPESTVRLWDPRTGQRITKFVGHTSMIRDILVNDAGDTVMTASSDQTVKVWSVTAGRCMHTLTMHNDSVWSLYSDDPNLEVFYSSDRSGMVVKTDVRGTNGEYDDGLSLALAQETAAVSKVVACGRHVWTATASSSINRWSDVDTGPDVALPEPYRTQYHRQRRPSVVSTVCSPTTSAPAPAAAAATSPAAAGGPAKNEIPSSAILRISNTAVFPSLSFNPSDANGTSGASLHRKGSEILMEPAVTVAEPIQRLPEETIEGQFGLVKHRLLNDRRRVLTLDTAGDVLLWDLIKCQPIQRFGKKHLEDVEPEVNTVEAVAPWCSIDTSSGNLTVVLEPFNCFDAEMYADELVTEEPVEFREDQRINLGKWILRYLFANLIDEEIRRDEAHRATLNEAVEKRIEAAKANPPTSIDLPGPPSTLLGPDDGVTPVATPRPNGSGATPGLTIGLATPAPQQARSSLADSLPTATPVEKRSSQLSRPSVERDDYFSNAIASVESAKPPATPAEPPTPATPLAEPKTPGLENVKDKDKDKENNGKSPSTPFGKKFRMGMSFGSKKLGRSASSTAPEKPAVVDEKAEEQQSESSSSHEKEVVDDSFYGVVQKIRNEYEKALAEAPDKLVETRVVPSLPSETPVLKLPRGTKVIIQEEMQGGSAELYRGTVETVGQDADAIEQQAPMWLGEVLLLNAVPPKEPVKVSFVLHPWQDTLPHIATTDGNNRLNANRMLRVRKILAYVAERIDPPEDPDNPDPDALKPEEYLELYCQDQLLPNSMSLATLRAHIWRGGNDVVLHYKGNGRKHIPIPPRPPTPPPQTQDSKPEEAPAPAKTASAVQPTTTTAAIAASLR
ncbi:WD repeat-containing protein 5B [Magnaporthiopsis poae ATCC 64411]|uniref:WD repeat-containing protein 5B n=1 Tax=Magnaporthiopsis poae (strain ATCC 64411 / 73-15) TaxID=644358 RepID=A0A0C4EDS5_MAGP6|nr:WD repeat-containing protein 5B [Magnaporthiopsis poae ATCC 64411]